MSNESSLGTSAQPCDVVDPEFSHFEEAERHVRRAGYMPANPLVQPLGAARRAQHRYLEYLSRNAPSVGRREDFVVPGPHGGMSLRLYHPARSCGATPIVYLRGGGWWAGNLDTSSRTMALICNETGLPVCGVDYRSTPEHRHPVQIEEVLAATRWLGDHAEELGVGTAGVVFWAESAGCTLAVNAAQRLLREPGPRILGMILFYGNFAGPGPATRPYSRWVWQQYLGDAPVEQHSAAVVLRAPVEGLSPAWIGVGDADPLLPDSVQLARRFTEASVPCEFVPFPGMPHGFVMMSRFLAPARAAIAEAAAAACRFAGGTSSQASIHEKAL